VPDDATEVVIAMTDLDAPAFVHWVMAGLNPKRGGLTEAEVPDGALLATNGAGTLGYTGPCPPSGTHTYQLTLYAFTGPSGVTEGMDGRAALAVVATSNVASASVTGTVSA
jgi:Raf kinase inhibitor-like YbhB/YbcL family protein